jgi:hypothetical protein
MKMCSIALIVINYTGTEQDDKTVINFMISRSVIKSNLKLINFSSTVSSHRWN